MDFSWSDEQMELYASVLRFAEAELADDSVADDRSGTFPAEQWRRCADFGVLGWAVPVEHGGSGHSPLAVVHLMEAFGYGCRDNGLAFGLGVQMWGLQRTLLRFGTERQIAEYLPGSIAGNRIGAYAINEDVSGSEAFAIETSADKDGAGWVLNGEKTLISFAPIADYAIVFAKTDPSAGRWGVSAFVVDTETPGFTTLPAEEWMGLRTIPFGRIRLEDCRVDQDDVLGREGAGASIFATSQAWERSLVLAPQLGAMKRLLDECVDLARNHLRGGVPIGKHQAVSHRIADMKLRLEAARLLVYKAAWLLERDKPNLMEAALAKIHLSEAFVRSSLDAILIHGGDGYTVQKGVERNLRDAIGGTIHGGTVDIQRNIVSGLLGL